MAQVAQQILRLENGDCLDLKVQQAQFEKEVHRAFVERLAARSTEK